MLDAIHAFLAVAETGSFSAVAKRLGVAVSSVSRKIDVLEAELGVVLFHRSSRRVALTDSGELFLPRARILLGEMDDAKAALSALRADPSGLLTLTAPSAFGRRHVSPAVASFLAKYPRMDVEMHLSDEVIDLSTRRVDVAVRIGSLPDSDLVATRLARLRRIACASPDYLARRGHPATPSALLQHNCLTVASLPAPAGWWCFAGVNQGRSLPVPGNFRTDDTEALLHAALAGVGVAHLASWLVSDPITSGRLVRLFEGDAEPAAMSGPAIHAVRMPGRSHAAKAQLFIAHLKAEFGDPAYWDKALLSGT